VLERGQVDLPQRALVDVGADPQPVGLLVVGGEVLDRRADVLGLDALHQGGAEPAGQVRVLAQVLEVAAAQRRPLDVDPRPEHHRDVLRPCLDPDRRADLADQVDVPGRAQRRRGGEAGRGQAAGDPDVVALGRLHAQPVRAVGQPDRLDAEPVDGGGVPEVRAQAEGGLLGGGQGRDGVLAGFEGCAHDDTFAFAPCIRALTGTGSRPTWASRNRISGSSNRVSSVPSWAQ
jgi:hypothetical protein